MKKDVPHAMCERHPFPATRLQKSAGLFLEQFSIPILLMVCPNNVPE